ncbi:hypothetical protein [Rubrobacter aplysinae]|uniref:hypothetical protein n=1 Tax=Rubrobacter aplysinae TaxID=909625 RepID=UPI00064BEC88|nr:hypothetical protein [Rubrobacter aplysinae]
MGPFRTGILYGIVAVVVALAANLHFLLLDASGTPGWILAVIEDFRTTLALAAFLIIGILAALRTTPERLDEGVSYRSLLLRDCTLAATLVAVIVGIALIIMVFLQATVLSGPMQTYASDAAPRIVAYIEELGDRFSDPAEPVTAAQIEEDLAPPTLGSLGQSISNFVLRALLLGVAGALVGLLRGRRLARSEEAARRPSPEETRDEKQYPYEYPHGDNGAVSRDGEEDGRKE